MKATKIIYGSINTIGIQNAIYAHRFDRLICDKATPPMTDPATPIESRINIFDIVLGPASEANPPIIKRMTATGIPRRIANIFKSGNAHLRCSGVLISAIMQMLALNDIGAICLIP